jgi:hypothetical protein
MENQGRAAKQTSLQNQEATKRGDALARVWKANWKMATVFKFDREEANERR